jgi:hypothetical protein
MTKKKIIFLALAGIIFLFTVTAVSGDLTSTDMIWYPWYDVIVIFPLLLIALLLILKYCKKTLKIVLTSIIVLAVLSSILYFVDVKRVYNNERPIFVIKTNNWFGTEYTASWSTNGISPPPTKNAVIYHGLGYKVVHAYFEDGDSQVMYNMFNSAVYGISNSYVPVVESDVSSWIGEYTYTETSETDGKITYEIKIVDINGNQLSERLKAEVSGYEEWVSLVFKEYITEPTNNKKYKEDDVLVGLQRKNSKLYTRWGWLKDYDMNAKQGVPITSFTEKQIEKI